MVPSGVPYASSVAGRQAVKRDAAPADHTLAKAAALPKFAAFANSFNRLAAAPLLFRVHGGRPTTRLSGIRTRVPSKKGAACYE